MLLHGKIGDFVIYEKGCGQAIGIVEMRIAYVSRHNGKTKVKKIIVKKSQRGQYSFESSDPNWVDSVSQLIDDAGEDYRQLLKSPFLGLNETSFYQ